MVKVLIFRQERGIIWSIDSLSLDFLIVLLVVLEFSLGFVTEFAGLGSYKIGDEVTKL